MGSIPSAKLRLRTLFACLILWTCVRIGKVCLVINIGLYKPITNNAMCVYALSCNLHLSLEWHQLSVKLAVRDGAWLCGSRQGDDVILNQVHALWRSAACPQRMMPILSSLALFACRSWPPRAPFAASSGTEGQLGLKEKEKKKKNTFLNTKWSFLTKGSHTISQLSTNK